MKLKAEAKEREMMKKFKNENNWQLYANNYKFHYALTEYEFNWERHLKERAKFLTKGYSEDMWIKVTCEVFRADFVMFDLSKYYDTFDKLITDFINRKGLYDGKVHMIDFLKITHLKFGNSLAKKAANDLMCNKKAVVEISDTAGIEVSICDGVSNGILVFDNEKIGNTYSERFELETVVKEIMIWYYSTISDIYAIF